MSTETKEKTETRATETTGRLIGVQHRKKQTKEGEARPTILWIEDGASTEGSSGVQIELQDDLAELDFVHGKLPTLWRAVATGENLTGIERHHIHFREPEDNETLESVSSIWPLASLDLEIKNRGRKNEKCKLLGIPAATAAAFTGMRQGDILLSIFGGSGHKLMVALINKATEIGACVLLTSPHNLKRAREAARASKDDDASTLVLMYRATPQMFHEMFERDVVTWDVLHAWDMTEEAMKQRLVLVQRAEEAASYSVYASREYVGSQLAQKVLDAKMGDKTVTDVIQSEKEAQEKLEESIAEHPLYQRLFSGIKGVGPRFFGKIMSAVQDVRRFPRKGIGAFLLFSGQAVVIVNGKHTIQRFRRQKAGENYPTPGNPTLRQAIWLLVDLQLSRQKDSTVWGKRFQEIKVKLRETHPYPELVCDTEIEIARSSAQIPEGWKIVFGKDKSYLFPEGRIREEGGKRILIVPPETIQLKGEWKTANGLCEITLLDGSKDYRPGTTRYTKIHIHKIAQRKLATEFMAWVFEEWWKFVEEQEAVRLRSQPAEQ
ncbi:MAG: hypothetical protein A3G59_02920 [Candidatus Taylorbacteria bacterium RIFCSPLOWO2_12_FULL_47_20]|uniref:Uncharacterized protein n=2 Tax=Candidatus Tayloriibacteriota TaxID=1817919 RepID=A0A1G2P6D2_9BACT|nr:MAG: hypothetical protein A3H68_00785 [Candidatus Taylorbacteria bacterium RIFCSPLOWO2_02_FULL_46_40]OHA43898.1 MAG: hypothetical protein A3G59_02920 [Candidatus Taylorbacteria bacterium RIFCSPLOWO2_12_FULL_47_20]